jgi:hypothetical protein
MSGALESSYSLEREELARVLSSKVLSRSQRLTRLLEYLCNKYFSGEEVKEYTVALEVMGQPPDFDEKSSATRVEVHRLRKKLQRYYETEGCNNPLQIVLEPGRYVPIFSSRAGRSANEEKEQATAGANAIQSEKIASVAADLATSVPNGRLTSRQLWRKFGFVGLAICLLIACAGVFGSFVFTRVRASRAGSSVPAAAGASVRLAGSQMPVRISCGDEKSGLIDHHGNVWSKDEFFQGGDAYRWADTARTPYIHRTMDPAIFYQVRVGNFSYNIPLAPGTYELKLYFSEFDWGEGMLGGGGEESRTFDIFMNDSPLLQAFDIIRDTGEPLEADVKVFKNVHPASDGKLHLDFRNRSGRSILAGIEVIPVAGDKMIPVRIVAADHDYVDSKGQIWGSDSFFRGGRATWTTPSLHDTSDVGLYRSQRYGNFNYLIPVTEGKFTLRLYFAETYFGVDNPGSRDNRVRSFDVHCNGVTLLKDFNPLNEAGPDHVIIKTFHGISPTAEGKLNLTFTPDSNLAMINAIEVVEE